MHFGLISSTSSEPMLSWATAPSRTRTHRMHLRVPFEDALDPLDVSLPSGWHSVPFAVCLPGLQPVYSAHAQSVVLVRAF